MYISYSNGVAMELEGWYARQSGGMVKHIGMGELNALPFFLRLPRKGEG